MAPSVRPRWIVLVLSKLSLDTLRFVPVVEGRVVLSIYCIKYVTAIARKKRPQAIYDALRITIVS